MEFKLVAETKVTVQITKKTTKQEEAYTYEASNGAKVAFHAHPTRAFQIVILEDTNELGKKYMNKLINAWVKAGINAEGEDRKAAFAAAIKTLKV